MARRKVKKATPKKKVAKVEKVIKAKKVEVEESKEVKKKKKLFYGSDTVRKLVLKVEDKEINGNLHKMVHLLDGSIEACTPEDYKKRIFEVGK